MRDVSEASLLECFHAAGGNRVKNADILRTFKPFIGHSDLQLRAKYREEFKLVIDRIAVVKTENGEKYLLLKKKYRQQLQERDSRALADPGPAPDATPPDATPPAAQQGGPPGAEQDGPRDELMECGESKEAEWEQDEESNGSLGSTSVALEPVEKEWIYSAAGARIPDLSLLLRQDPGLAHKKDFTSGFTALHWAAKHGNTDMATLVAEAGADVNTKSHGGYTPLHIAALHGHRHILHLLVETYGAKENLRDYSGHLALHYLNVKEVTEEEEECDMHSAAVQARERHRNRKLASLFSSRKKWGSAEELAPIEEERAGPLQLAPPPFRPRKFSR